MTFLTVLSTEILKLRRTRVLWVLALLYSVAPAMMGFMMAILRNPDLARRMGLLTAKAELTIGSADWPTYLMLVGFLYVGGVIVLGVAQAYVFGREYAEGTAKNMLALPIGRHWIITTKLTVTILWFALVAVALYGEALGIGFLVGLPGFEPVLVVESARLAVRLAIQVLLLSSVPAWIAVATRGYIAPMGLSILLFLVGDLFAHTGWGPWVPWSIVLLSAGAAGPGGPVPGVASWLVLIGTFVAGALAAWATLERADNTQ